VEDFLTQNGPTLAYIILLVGSFFEGESVVLTAGVLAYKGYLSLPAIIAIAFAGSVLADQLLFYIGRFYGPNIFKRYKRLQEPSERAFRLLRKYNVGFIIGFRFIYGIRLVSPLLIGASGISIIRFTLLNLSAALLWATLSCIGGYYIGYLFADRIMEIFNIIFSSQKYIALALAAVVILVSLYVYLRKRRKERLTPD